MTSAQPAEKKTRTLFMHLSGITGVTLTAGLAVGAMVIGVSTLHSRANQAAAPAPNPVITVATQKVAWADHYKVRRGYIGRLEPARETAVAFERGGLVLDVRFDEGDLVRQGDVIATLDKAKLLANRRELQARRQELEARRDLAKLTMARQDKLKSRGWSPEQRFDEARFNVAELSAGIARVEASIAALDVDIRKSELLAPFDGRVARRNVDEGAVVAAGTQVLTILEAGQQQARIGLSPEAAAALVVGESYELTADQRRLTGRLRALRADLDTGSRTVTALIALTGESAVPLGDIVVLNLSRKVDVRGVWLPVTALVEGRKGLWTVMIARDTEQSPMIEREAVEVLHVADDRAFVRGALREGDKVVTTGTNRVTPGQRVALARLN